MNYRVQWTNRFKKDYKLCESRGFRECHIKPDWLMVYAINNGILTLTLSRTGTHSDLF